MEAEQRGGESRAIPPRAKRAQRRGSVMSASAIRSREMTKRYRGQVAVDRLTVEVPAGSVFGLLGENGAGKTTTILSLLGLIAPDAGRVATLGLDPARRGLEVRRRVGYVPEQVS